MTNQFMLDKKTILARLGGDEELFSAMADMYLQEADDYCARITAALAARDGRLLRREAHTIKSLLAAFIDEKGVAMAMAVEREALAGNLTGLEGPVADIQNRLRSVAAALTEEKQEPLAFDHR